MSDEKRCWHWRIHPTLPNCADCGEPVDPARYVLPASNQAVMAAAERSVENHREILVALADGASIDRATASPDDIQSAMRQALDNGRTLTITENGKPRMQVCRMPPIAPQDEAIVDALVAKAQAGRTTRPMGQSAPMQRNIGACGALIGPERETCGVAWPLCREHRLTTQAPEPVVWPYEDAPFTGEQVRVLLEENARLWKVAKAAHAVVRGRVPAVSCPEWVHSRISDSLTNKLADALAELTVEEKKG